MVDTDEADFPVAADEETDLTVESLDEKALRSFRRRGKVVIPSADGQTINRKGSFHEEGWKL